MPPGMRRAVKAGHSMNNRLEENALPPIQTMSDIFNSLRALSYKPYAEGVQFEHAYVIVPYERLPYNRGHEVRFYDVETRRFIKEPKGIIDKLKSLLDPFDGLPG